jgi:hypothetical protein
MASRNNSKLTLAQRIVRVETICDYTKEAINKLDENQKKMFGILDVIREQVTTNKIKIGIYSGIAGIVGGALVTAIVKVFLQ